MSSRLDILQLLYENKISAREALVRMKQLKNSTSDKKAHVVKGNTSMDIAIVGMSGQFPGAKNVDEFWRNLVQGTDSVHEITRWDLESFYDETGKDTKKSYSKWGGFLSDIDMFDPFFFELSPKQAELMEPRQRLFLLEAWKTFEDAGYSRDEVSGSRCGVFVGCEGSTEYFDQMKKEEMNAHVFLGHSNSVLASRIAYVMNLQGPCVTVDTACSSSLVSIHLAVESLQSGACDIALAGGVNVMTSPGGYVLLSSMNALSYTGKCRAFDDGADGFVPGEAVGAILLKPLVEARKHNDRIYAVIKGSMVNQDGKTNGIMAPSSLSQARLEKEVYELANISPETIDYIEAHGTGTKLGDPIEVNALKMAFEGYTQKKQFCGIGSVKSNIGHASAASGIASMIKVLLSMKNKKLVPSLHFEKENSQLHLADSPFYVVNQLMDWKKEDDLSRRAAVSSFGHGGTNCHILLEEEKSCSRKLAEKERMIVLSAKTNVALTKKVEDMLAWLDGNGKNAEYADIAYMLSVGRDHFAYRVGFLCSSKEEMKQKLNEFENRNAHPFFSGRLKPEEVNLLSTEVNKIIHEVKVNRLYTHGQLEKILELYVKGAQVSWDGLFVGEDVRRIEIPTYPFQLRPYWIPKELCKEQKEEGIPVLSSLVDSNVSDLNGLKFRKRYTGNEFFLKDHMNMLPAVVYIEMVRQMSDFANRQKKVCGFKNFVWANPVLVNDEGKEVEVQFISKTSEQVDTKIVTYQDGVQVLHAQASVMYGERNTQKIVDLESVKRRCNGDPNALNTFYESIEKNGVHLGKRFRGMVGFYYNESEALSELAIPEILEGSFDRYCIHPTLTDGGFQTVINWAYHTNASKEVVYLPFVLEELVLYNMGEKVKYAYVTKNQDDSYNVLYLGASGNVLLEAKKFTFKQMTLKEGMINSTRNSGAETLYYHMERVETQIIDGLSNSLTNKKIYLFDDDSSLEKLLREQYQFDVRRICLGQQINKDYLSVALDENCRNDYEILFKELPEMIIVRCGKLNDWVIVQEVFHMLTVLAQKRLKQRVKIIVLKERELLQDVPLMEALDGLFRNALAEERSIYGKLMLVEKSNLSDITQKLVYESTIDTIEHVVEYESGKRYVQRLREQERDNENKVAVFVQNGTYIITGGCGGLGYQISQYLSEKYHANLILVGRSEMSESIQKLVDMVNSLGGTALYQSVDIANKEDCEKLKQLCVLNGKEIHGIIHTAGVVNDSMLVNKRQDEIDAVLLPKVYGSQMMVETFKDYVKDVIVFFSSMTAVVGNVGQCDYGYANSFMDAYARMLNKQGYGFRTISIDWPFWENGGMKMNVHAERMMETVYGMTPLSFEQGMDILETAMKEGYENLIPFYGNKSKIKAIIHKQEEKQEIASKVASREGKNAEFVSRFAEDVVSIIGNVLKVDREMLTLNTSMDEYGFDSVSYTELANEMNQKFHLSLTPTVFFGCASPKEIVTNLVEDYSPELEAFYKDSETQQSDDIVITEQHSKKDDSVYYDVLSMPQAENPDYEPVAIIGFSCKMPDSDNKEEFWEHIKAGSDLVKEIPADRWNWKEYYTETVNDEFKTNVKYGAFMKYIDEFDPLFFKIAGLDTELMDPQERLVLENTWCAIEDAGYKVTDLSDTNTGVFVGVSTADYKELLVENNVTTIFSQAFIANRVSYVFNLKGPSEPVDTACSSSLVAIHRAIEQIHNGNCEMAIAGGVNVITCPNLYVTQTKAGMLAVDGRCKTFDQSADGYGRGEGCGIVILKSLKKAKMDHDHIYAVIRGTAVAHGGHGNNIFSPNANEQAKVIQRALEISHIDPLTLSYIEAHGTGTSLGDPIEIEGISKALKRVYQSRNMEMPSEKTIGLGTVKTNIGHLEAASGIAGVIKVLLCMKNGMLPKVVHFSQLNPYIKLDGTPLYIVEENQVWEHQFNEKGSVIPRRAGISSFGIGGVNAHLIMEEYISKDSITCSDEKLRMIPVSAKSESSMKKMVRNLCDSLEKTTGTDERTNQMDIASAVCKEIASLLEVDESEVDLDLNMDVIKSDMVDMMRCRQMLLNEFGYNIDIFQIQNMVKLRELVDIICEQDFSIKATNNNIRDIAFTLQNGREAMEYRVVFLVRSERELIEKCNHYLSGYEDQDVITGKVKRENYGKLSVQKLQRLYNEQKYQEIANAWVIGSFDSWNGINEEEKKESYRISLPTYAFEREKYWIPDGKKVKKEKRVLHNNVKKLDVSESEKTVKNSEGGKREKDDLFLLLKQMEKNESLV